ncbi:MAG: hypothetical protein RL701_3149 [Pseudomonadota bacterium]
MTPTGAFSVGSDCLADRAQRAGARGAHALAVAAAVDTDVPETERTLFQRVSEALQLDPADDTLDTLARTFRESGLAKATQSSQDAA